MASEENPRQSGGLRNRWKGHGIIVPMERPTIPFSIPRMATVITRRSVRRSDGRALAVLATPELRDVRGWRRDRRGGGRRGGRRGGPPPPPPPCGPPRRRGPRRGAPA